MSASFTPTDLSGNMGFLNKQKLSRIDKRRKKEREEKKERNKAYYEKSKESITKKPKDGKLYTDCHEMSMKK